jgi:hypothetical protein
MNLVLPAHAWARKGGYRYIAVPLLTLFTELINVLQQLEAEKSDLERSVAELKLKCEVIETRENERRAAEERKHADEVSYLKKYTEQLKVQLDTYLTSGKKGPPGTAVVGSADTKPSV